MEARGGVRSSARLVAGNGATSGNANAANQPAPSERERAARAADAASRRARAAERAREVEDSPRVLRDKCRRLARALRNAKHLVVYTGAGISTAADIPDYRGPHGVWTRLQRGETVGRVDVSGARPTLTHMALTALWSRGALKFVVSQNCDGLHMRSGLPRRALAELHGDMFAERCPACRRVYLRAFDVTQRTARHAHGTRRLCHSCPAELRDTIVHFGERGRAAWPLNWAGALRHAASADVILCLGSSLKVLRRYPRLWCMHRAPRARPALYIVNLQWTPKDSVAALKINARCDDVMAEVARRLRLRVPRYSPRRDPLLAHATPLAPPEEHTTSRPHLAPATERPPSARTSSPDLSSPSPSESDDELPLCRLARRLRPPPPLHSFQVNMCSGEATILLRAEHAPSVQPPPEPPPALVEPLPSPEPDPRPKQLSELRRFRFMKTDRRLLATSGVTNGLSTIGPFDGATVVKKEEKDYDDESQTLGSKLRRLLEYEPKIEIKQEAKTEPAAGVKPEQLASSPGSSDSEGSAGSLAAAIIRRAVLVCRGQLYPGLHTILGAGGAGGHSSPPPAPSARAECAWCARQLASRRCLWYGPPACTALAARRWRRVRGRRYLCACCGDAPCAQPDDGGGWYGKGYRKGRRRRR